MNFFNKRTITIVILVIFLFPYFVQAETCSPDGYTVATINGINTNEADAKGNMIALEKILGFSQKNQSINYQYFYNPTHGKIIDALDVTNQIYFDKNSFNIEDSDFAQMLSDASAKLTTQKVLLVSHSQGNFYANTFYDAVADEEGGVPSISIGVYGVASPASRVAGGGLYLTSDTDEMIIGTVAKFPLVDILKPNTHINFKADDDPLGHSFSKTYLAYKGSRIIADIKTSLNKLQENDEQVPQDPCISPPKLTWTQKIQGKVLAIIDPVSIPLQASIVNVAISSYKIATTIGNRVLNGMSTLASAISSLTQSLFNNTKTLATNNPASVISATDDTNSAMAESVSPNTTPRTTRENSKSIEKSPVPENIPVKNSTPTLQTEATPPPETTEASSSTSPIVPIVVSFGYGVTGTSSAPQTEEDSSNTDTTAPVISLVGDNSMEITKNSTYTDAGATALDEKDGVVNVVTTGTVDTAVVGVYTITYTATDAANNVATASRIVNVVEPPPPDTTPPDVPIANALSLFTNTDDVTVTGTAEADSTITITGGTNTATGIATDGNFSISVPLNQNTLNTLSITATDAANNTSNPATVSTTHDNLPPVISSLAFNEPPANVMLVGRSFTLNINADTYGYTAGAITINEVPATGFRDNLNDTYTVTHTVAFGETDRTSGAVPVSVVLTDAAGNSNIAHTEIRGNGVVIKGHYPASVTQVFPSFDSSTGKFTEDVVLPCVTNSGYFQMYYVRDSDSTFRMMNTLAEVPYSIRCLSDSKRVVDNGMGFADFLGYAPITGWYYGIVSIGSPKCDASKNDTVCVNDNIQSFFRLYRSADGIWSDTNI